MSREDDCVAVLHQHVGVCQRAGYTNGLADAGDALRPLVSDWQANGNSRELGDPTAAAWHKAAEQLLKALDGLSDPDPAQA